MCSPSKDSWLASVETSWGAYISEVWNAFLQTTYCWKNPCKQAADLKPWHLGALCRPWGKLVKLMAWAWCVPLKKNYTTALLLVLDITEKLNPFTFPVKGKYHCPPPASSWVTWAGYWWGVWGGISLLTCLWQGFMGMTCVNAVTQNIGGPHCVIGCPDHCQQSWPTAELWLPLIALCCQQWYMKQWGPSWIARCLGWVYRADGWKNSVWTLNHKNLMSLFGKI